MDSHCLDTAARLAALLARRTCTSALPGNIFLNVNLPDLPLAEIKGVRITRLASGTHVDVAEEGNDGNGRYYRLVRHRTGNTFDNQTDVWAIEQGNISLTPLHTDLLGMSTPAIPDSLCSDLLNELMNRTR